MVIELVDAYFSDWSGVYIDGNLIHEGHQTPSLNEIEDTLRTQTDEEITQEYIDLEEFGYDPETDESIVAIHFGGRLPQDLQELREFLKTLEERDND